MFTSTPPVQENIADKKGEWKENKIQRNDLWWQKNLVDHRPDISEEETYSATLKKSGTCASPGKAKRDKLIQLKEKLGKKTKELPVEELPPLAVSLQPFCLGSLPPVTEKEPQSHKLFLPLPK